MVNFGRDRLDAVFAALADPTRRAIVRRLSRGPSRVSALAAPHRMSLAAISKHIGVLEDVGIVMKRKEGRTVICRLRPAPLKRASDWLIRYERFWTERLDALGNYLERGRP